MGDYIISISEEQRELLLKLIRAEIIVADDYQAHALVQQLEALEHLFD